MQAIYGELALVSALAVYIVDLSGFTDSWRGAVARWMGVSSSALRPLPPLDCGQCMSWWSCIVYSVCVGEFSLCALAWSALLAFLSPVTGQLLLLVRETLLWAARRLFDIVDK